MFRLALVFAFLGFGLALDQTTNVNVNCKVDVVVTYPEDPTADPTVECTPTCDGSGWVQQRMYYREPKLDSEYRMMVEVSSSGAQEVTCELVHSATDAEITAQENDIGEDEACHIKLKEPKTENPCEEGFVYVKELATCYAVSDYEAQWSDSECDCAAKGATLATIDSAEEQAIVTAFLEESVWIGLSDEKMEGLFEWRDGTPLDYQNWASNEPSGNPEGDCVAMDAETGFMWREESCDSQKRFLCEPAKEIEPVVTCPYKYELNQETGSCYRVTSDKQNWGSSETTCVLDGGKLATFETEAEMTAVQGYVTDNVWIGLNDKSKESTYVWADDSSLSFKGWDANQPDNHKRWWESEDEDCVEFRANSKKWNDLKCSTDRKAMCERDAEVFPRTSCPSGWTEFDSACYKLIDVKSSYNDAVKSCFRQAAGSTLMFPRSAEENSFALALGKGDSVWVGINDRGRRNEGEFISEDGEHLTYTNWARGQPDNHRGREDCVHILTSGGWNDQTCSDKIKFICVTPKFRGAA